MFIVPETFTELDKKYSFLLRKVILIIVLSLHHPTINVYGNGLNALFFSFHLCFLNSLQAVNKPNELFIPNGR